MQNEARIMTDEDIQKLKEGQFVWIQFRTQGLYCLQITGIGMGAGRVSYMQFNSPNAYIEVLFSDNTFRLWTCEPTEEQMNEVEW